MSTATAKRLTAILHREEEVYVAGCPEAGTVSQGDTVEEALANLRQAEMDGDSFIQALLPTLGMAASSL